jgi:hypothetical protein
MFDNITGFSKWLRAIDGTDEIHGSGISADGAGNFVATGIFSGTVNIGDKKLISNGASDIYVARFDVVGQPLWAFDAGGVFNDSSSSVLVDNDDIAYLSGNFQTQSHFGNIVLNGDGSSSFYLAKMANDPTGILNSDPVIEQSVLFPNPSRSKFYFYPYPGCEEIGFLQISDATGKVLETGNKNSINPYYIDLESFPAGLYFVQWRIENKVHQAKIIKY